MKVNQLLLTRTALCLFLGSAGLAEAWQPGTYPDSPQRMHSSGLAVNNQDRNDVVAFWHAVYQASEGYEKRINWTGNYSGNNGTISDDFVNDVERRVNYFRAMCGVHSDVVVSSNSTVTIESTDPFKPSSSTLKAKASQEAALMLVRNYNPQTGTDLALSHNPPSHLTGWSTAAWNANSKGNFAFGLYGPGAITEYMVEQLTSSTLTSSWNSLVGHRRWNLFPRATTFATGDQPGSSVSKPPTNVFYVLQKPSEMPDRPSGFVAYPAAGFFPVSINSPYWSLSRDGADFTFANVKMTDANGNAVPIRNIQRSTDYGDPAIVWEVSPAVNIRSVAKDTTFNVRVSGIGGVGIPASHSYSVTLINPDLLTSNQQIAGPSTVPPNATGTYTFSAPAGAESVQVVAFRQNSSRWKENAEDPGNSNIIDGTTGNNYPLIVKPSSFQGFGVVSGARSFHLTFPTAYDVMDRGVPDQSFELGRDLITNSKSKLSFQFRRGFMTRGSILVIESSTNGGVTWKVLGDPIKGVSDTRSDISVSSTNRSLPASALPIRIRFRYFTKGGAIYTHEAAPKSPTGIFIDEITTTDCDWLEQRKANVLAATENRFVFKSSTAGDKLETGDEWKLRLRTQLGGKWFPHGPAKTVKITASSPK
ncbi:MAG: hypothetical protein V4819_08655 [Verrucomicrobiota bacterium]